MPDESTLPIKIVIPRETLTWKNFPTPMQLLKLIEESCVVVTDGQLEGMLAIESDIRPGSEHLDKLWVKTSDPPGIGVPSGGQFHVIYRYPPDVPFLANFESEGIPAFVSQLDPATITAFGLTDTNPAATNRMRWHIFQPEEL